MSKKKISTRKKNNTKKIIPKKTKTKLVTGSKVKALSPSGVLKSMKKKGFKSAFANSKIEASIKKMGIQKMKEFKVPQDQKNSEGGMNPKRKSFHGIKLNKKYFPWVLRKSTCKNTFCYLTPTKVRTKSRLPFNQTNRSLLESLGIEMGLPGPSSSPDSNIPAGYTYFGQFVDHDITLDVSSTLDSLQNATKIENMRTPRLDLDNLYGRGPGLDPALYVFPLSGTAIKMHLGTNIQDGPGGPSSGNTSAGMQTQNDFDVPRVNSTLTAVIGDPRNDENLIVSQFHHAMLKYHNKVVDFLVNQNFPNDIFLEAKRLVTHHYQWVIINDFLKRICGPTAVKSALKKVRRTKGNCMPVEFSVAAYRFGHSLVRNNDYWVNFNFPFQSLFDLFAFIRPNHIPVRNSWIVDFNAFFPTGKVVPVNNKAKKIDTILAAGLSALPGNPGPPGNIFGILAGRNLVRGMALGLPSGQAVAKYFGFTPLTSTQLLAGLKPSEKAILNSSNGKLLKKTPLWYYILREARVKASGNRLGPVGSKIVADTFVRILKNDPESYLNQSTTFSPSLPKNGSQYDVADIIIFSGVHLP